MIRPKSKSKERLPGWALGRQKQKRRRKRRKKVKKKVQGSENRKEEEGAKKKMKQRLSVRNLQKKLFIHTGQN